MDNIKVVDGIRCGSNVKVIAASRSESESFDNVIGATCPVLSIEQNDLITLEMTYWRAIHAEIMTHGRKSISASSSRAIPVNKQIEAIRQYPFGPVKWGKNQPGMQAYTELEGNDLVAAKATWLALAERAANGLEAFNNIGLHKQVANRVSEPYMPIHVVMTTTRKNWEAILRLRIHHAAQPEFQELAQNIKYELDNLTPRILKEGEWHLPYITDEEREEYSIDDLLVMSAARCCRVSYAKHGGGMSTLEEDRATCQKLHIEADSDEEPAHRSPAEHQAKHITGKDMLGIDTPFLGSQKKLKTNLVFN